MLSTSSPSPEKIHSPEYQLLLAAIAVQDPDSSRLQRALAAPVDWSLLLAYANHHQVIPLLYRRLSPGNFPYLPAATLEQLKGQYWTIALRNQRLAETLLQVIDLLAQANIPALPFKGPALAILAYGDLSMRPFLDLDFLVPEASVQAAIQVLASAGFRPEAPLEFSRLHRAIRTAYHLRLRRTSPTHPIDWLEIHWTIADRSHVHPLRAGDLWQNLQSLNLLGRKANTFSVENTLLAACLHGTSNHWQHLKWIADLAYLLPSTAGLDWERFLHRTRRLGYLRLLLLGLHLSNQACHAILPEAVAQAILADQAVTALGQIVLDETLPIIAAPGSLANNRFFLRSRERLADRLYYLFDQALIPKSTDWDSLPLPEGLYPLYYLLRPLRLAKKFSRRSTR